MYFYISNIFFVFKRVTICPKIQISIVNFPFLKTVLSRLKPLTPHACANCMHCCTVDLFVLTLSYEGSYYMDQYVSSTEIQTHPLVNINQNEEIALEE